MPYLFLLLQLFLLLLSLPFLLFTHSQHSIQIREDGQDALFYLLPITLAFCFLSTSRCLAGALFSHLSLPTCSRSLC